MESQIICGDCIEEMKKIPNESIDLIITDPPFMISREAKITRSRNPKKYKYVGKDIEFMFGEWDCFDSEEDYWKFTYAWLKESLRILKKGGHFLIFFDKFKITPLVKWFKENNCIARQPLFWIKENPVPMARKVSFMNAISLIFWATKHSTSRKYATFNYKLGQHKDYILAPICGGKERYEYGFHPTQKPIKVIKWLLKYLSNEGDIVCDPFVGSGTTAVACKQLGRKFIGCDNNPEYIKIANKRLSQEVLMNGN
jgi:DNA modification methylase